MRRVGHDLRRAAAPLRAPAPRPYLTFIPGCAPVSGASRQIPEPSPLAASTLPSERPIFILLRAMLATLTVSRPIGNSGAQADLMPANTSRGALKGQKVHLDLHEAWNHQVRAQSPHDRPDGAVVPRPGWLTRMRQRLRDTLALRRLRTFPGEVVIAKRPDDAPNLR